MTQKCKITFSNISKGEDMVRICDSKNQALMWLNHQLVKSMRLQHCNELFVRLESYSEDVFQDSVLPF